MVIPRFWKLSYYWDGDQLSSRQKTQPRIMRALQACVLLYTSRLRSEIIYPYVHYDYVNAGDIALQNKVAYITLYTNYKWYAYCKLNTTGLYAYCAVYTAFDQYKDKIVVRTNHSLIICSFSFFPTISRFSTRRLVLKLQYCRRTSRCHHRCCPGNPMVFSLRDKWIFVFCIGRLQQSAQSQFSDMIRNI